MLCAYCTTKETNPAHNSKSVQIYSFSPYLIVLHPFLEGSYYPFSPLPMSYQKGEGTPLLRYPRSFPRNLSRGIGDTSEEVSSVPLEGRCWGYSSVRQRKVVQLDVVLRLYCWEDFFESIKVRPPAPIGFVLMKLSINLYNLVLEVWVVA